jgi:hypothetical protein
MITLDDEGHGRGHGAAACGPPTPHLSRPGQYGERAESLPFLRRERRLLAMPAVAGAVHCTAAQRRSGLPIARVYALSEMSDICVPMH